MVVSDVTLSTIRAKRMCRSFLWNLHKQRLTWRIRAIVCLYLAVHFASDLRMTWTYQDVDRMISLLGLDKGGTKCR